MRYPIVVGNWKMNLGRANEALAFVRRVRHPLNQIEGVETVLGPPFTVLASLAEMLSPLRLSLAAQTMHWEDHGAYTGEVSPAMLAELCRYVILGHSERRTGRVSSLIPDPAHTAENDAAVNRKAHAALAHGLAPIICVGEDLEQRDAGRTHQIVGRQVRAAMVDLTRQQAERCLVAYEPIWAIGAGKAATPADVNRVIGLTVRGVVAELYGELAASSVRVLYGGSVSADNIAAFMVMPEVDGALVGGASLGLEFVDLVRRAAPTA